MPGEDERRGTLKGGRRERSTSARASTEGREHARASTEGEDKARGVTEGQEKKKYRVVRTGHEGQLTTLKATLRGARKRHEGRDTDATRGTADVKLKAGRP